MSDTEREMTRLTNGRLTEWLSDNQHRAYPLDTTTGGVDGTIPCAVFVDALLTTTGIDTEHLFINKVIVDTTSAKFYVSDDESLSWTAMIADIPLTTTTGTEIAVDYKDDSHVIFGGLVVGDITAINLMPSVSELDESAGRFFPSCVRDASSWLVGLNVDGKILTGIVNLVAGDGVEFVTTVSGDTTTVTIKAKEYEIPQETRDQLIENDSELLTRLEDTYGKPVRTINGVMPDTDGNIDIRVEDTTTASYTADGTGTAGYIVLKNSEDNTGCCDDNAIDIIMNNIANLNERAARMDASITVVDNNLNTIATQLVGIK